jgi:RimJ/RimL family protein N-acetyltransferase
MHGLTLLPIDRNGVPSGLDSPHEEPVASVLNATAEYYTITGFDPPWIGYLAVEGSTPVGACSYKSAPVRGRVEIAYYTFPQYEGRGWATLMAAELVAVAQRNDPQIVICAQTLPEKNASHRVLEKAGFRAGSIIDHPEDGPVLEWLMGATDA